MVLVSSMNLRVCFGVVMGVDVDADSEYLLTDETERIFLRTTPISPPSPVGAEIGLLLLPISKHPSTNCAP
jgi:hypothetical protein